MKQKKSGIMFIRPKRPLSLPYGAFKQTPSGNKNKNNALCLCKQAMSGESLKCEQRSRAKKGAMKRLM